MLVKGYIDEFAMESRLWLTSEVYSICPEIPELLQ